MGPLATWSLIGAVVLFVGFITWALMRTAANADRMSQRWLERQWLEDHKERLSTWSPTPDRPLYDQDEEA